MANSKNVHSLTNDVHGQQEAGLRRKNTNVSEKLNTDFFKLKEESYLQSKLVEEVVEEILNAAQHAIIQVAPGDVMEERSGGRWNFVAAETLEFLMSVDGHFES